MTLVKLPVPVKQRWLKWLRTKENRQAKQRLAVKHEDGSFAYCCMGGLGIVCSLLSDQMRHSIFLFTGSGGNIFALDPAIQATMLQVVPPELLKEVGIDKDYVEMTVQYLLSDLNDVHDWSFSRIAQWVEKYL